MAPERICANCKKFTPIKESLDVPRIEFISPNGVIAGKRCCEHYLGSEGWSDFRCPGENGFDPVSPDENS